MRTVYAVRPILTALRSHRAAATLLMLEIALTLAVLCNLVFIVSGTFQRSGTPTGVVEDDIGLIQSIGVIGGDDDSSGNPDGNTAGGSLAALQAVPGVQSAAYGGPPLWGTERTQLFADPSSQQPLARAYVFSGSQGLNRTLGVRVVQGSDIRDDELPSIPDLLGEHAASMQMPALLTQALAQRMFPDGKAVGKLLYTSIWGGHPVTLRIVGVIDHLRGEITGRPDDDEAILTELKVASEGLGGGYMIRSKPGQLRQTLPLAAKAMEKANPGHVQQKVQSMADLRADYFKADRALAGILTTIMAILLAVTALGIGGLASFWVQQRTRQIGIRRALGATRGDILRYFQMENFLIVGGGLLLGCLLAYALNQFLMQRFELSRLPPSYLALGVPALWLLGQLAVLGPALRAARIPPAIATRNA
jgi:putative ABC transport system permease protein